MIFGSSRRIPFAVIVFCFVFLMQQSAMALTARQYAIELTATIQESPAQVTISWPNTPDGIQFEIARKQKNGTSWSSLAILAATATSYTDSSVSFGNTYEYRVTKYPEQDFPRTGYIFVGLGAPLLDYRGKLLLIVEETHASYLGLELARLQEDLVGDGWTVVRRSVSRSDSPASVRQLIQTESLADSSIRAVFLFGRVPVPYSGNYQADDHADHKGAWAADAFYGDLNGTWTDSTVNTTTAARVSNRNIPGDGKYDQSTIPSDIDLEVGRVDLANMPAFLPKGEKELLAQYLNKDHAFRHGQVPVGRRAILFDGFGESGGEAYAASGWRNFAPFFGSANINAVGQNQFLPTVNAQSYLWSYVASGGGDQYNDCYFVGTTTDVAQTNIHSVFNMVFGSYFGDWDAANDFLRAPLAATGYALTAAWSGRPHWFFHHMAVGETIGYSTRLSQNNQGLYEPARFGRQVHIALMGDPTLRMHVVLPPSNLTAAKSDSTVTLNWAASADPNVVGYHVYRSLSANGPFVRVTGATTTDRTYMDNSGTDTYVYMVRAIKLERTPSGSYYNASQGVFVNGSSSQAGVSVPENIAGHSFTFIPDGSSGISDRMIIAVFRNDTLRLYRSDGTSALQTNSYVYNHDSTTSASIAFGDTLISLEFVSGAAGTFSAVNLAGNTYSGTFGLLDAEPDFNQDGHVDLLFQGQNRVLYSWYLNGQTFVRQGALRNGTAIAPDWRAVGSSDFNGDGKSDILFQHTDGRHAVWLLDGPNFIGSRQLAGVRLPPAWKSVALADFNDDGIADILFQHSTGGLAVGFLDQAGTTILRTARPNRAPPAGWRVFAAGDFNQDRNSDILVQQNSTGKMAVWYYNNLQSIGAKLLRDGRTMSLAIKALGIADLNNDGKNDVLLQSNSGSVNVWFMDNTAFIGSAALRNGIPMTVSGARLIGPN